MGYTAPTDGMRDVVNKKKQPPNAGKSEQHGSAHGCDRRKGLRQGTRSWKRSHTVRKSPKKYSERPLRHAIPYKADDDTRGELHGGQRESHQQDRENDGNHRHDGTGDS